METVTQKAVLIKIADEMTLLANWIMDYTRDDMTGLPPASYLGDLEQRYRHLLEEI